MIEIRLAKYSEIRSKLHEITEKFSTILEEIKRENSLFLEAKKSNPALKQREIALQNLEDAYQNFTMLSGNFTEGISFYSDLKSHLTKLKDNCQDFVYSRQLEYKDMLRAIQSIASGIPQATKPSLPPRSEAPPLPPKPGSSHIHVNDNSGAYSVPGFQPPQYHAPPQYSNQYEGSYQPSAPQQGSWHPGLPINYRPFEEDQRRH